MASGAFSKKSIEKPVAMQPTSVAPWLMAYCNIASHKIRSSLYFGSESRGGVHACISEMEENVFRETCPNSSINWKTDDLSLTEVTPKKPGDGAAQSGGWGAALFSSHWKKSVG